MAGSPSNSALLVELAKEASSEKRRELLRQVTDVLLVESQTRTDREGELFGEIVGAVAADLEMQVRIELAEEVAASRLAIRGAARRLAFDVIEVARPVLEKSTALTQSDLVDVIQQTSQDHMMAVTKRPDIGERAASALVARAEDRAVASLLRNPLARISRETYERVARRALASPALHAPFVRRMNAPLDLLNEVYLKVSAALREEIIGKLQGEQRKAWRQLWSRAGSTGRAPMVRCPQTISAPGRTLTTFTSAPRSGPRPRRRCCAATSTPCS